VRQLRRFPALLGIIATLSSCGGGSTTGGGAAIAPTTPTTPTTSTCSLRSRQDSAFTAINEWYLFPETLPASLDPSPYTTVTAYIDALTATARAQSKDRFFTYITSIAEENAFINSGSSAGFGVRLSTDSAAQRVFIAEAFEGAPAFAVGIDRGTEITAIGDTPTTMRLVTEIFAASGSAGITNALGPSTPGTTRTLRIVNAGVTSDVTVSKADYSLPPVSSRYGAKVLTDGTRKIGYLNLRTFIATANPQLTAAFANFKAQGINEFIIDVRYNGGGLVSTAELFGDLLGGGRTTSDVFSNTTFRASKSSNNEIKRFAPRAESVSPSKIAFITTGSSASASELIANAMIPFLGNNIAIVGSNSYGKPVGQIALDRAACDDRMRVVAFATLNAAGNGGYYTGLASTMPNACRAADDITKPLGDPNEASVKGALDFLAGRSCTPIIASGGQSAQSVREQNKMLTPDTPTAAQRDVPGLF
jgi:carboxyl-terminal processing protease